MNEKSFLRKIWKLPESQEHERHVHVHSWLFHVFPFSSLKNTRSTDHRHTWSHEPSGMEERTMHVLWTWTSTPQRTAHSNRRTHTAHPPKITRRVLCFLKKKGKWKSFLEKKKTETIQEPRTRTPCALFHGFLSFLSKKTQGVQTIGIHGAIRNGGTNHVASSSSTLCTHSSRSAGYEYSTNSFCSLFC